MDFDLWVSSNGFLHSIPNIDKPIHPTSFGCCWCCWCIFFHLAVCAMVSLRLFSMLWLISCFSSCMYKHTKCFHLTFHVVVLLHFVCRTHILFHIELNWLLLFFAWRVFFLLVHRRFFTVVVSLIYWPNRLSLLVHIHNSIQLLYVCYMLFFFSCCFVFFLEWFCNYPSTTINVDDFQIQMNLYIYLNHPRFEYA